MRKFQVKDIRGLTYREFAKIIGIDFNTNSQRVVEVWERVHCLLGKLPDEYTLAFIEEPSDHQFDFCNALELLRAAENRIYSAPEREHVFTDIPAVVKNQQRQFKDMMRGNKATRYTRSRI